MLAESLRLLPTYALADIYEMLYQPEIPFRLTEEEYRQAISAYWDDPKHWDELVEALSVPERQLLTRLAMQSPCKINAFMEELSQLGLIMLERERNRYELPDDVRIQLLERLPSLRDRMVAQEEGDGEGGSPV